MFMKHTISPVFEKPSDGPTPGPGKALFRTLYEGISDPLPPCDHGGPPRSLGQIIRCEKCGETFSAMPGPTATNQLKWRIGCWHPEEKQYKIRGGHGMKACEICGASLTGRFE